MQTFHQVGKQEAHTESSVTLIDLRTSSCNNASNLRLAKRCGVIPDKRKDGR